MKGSAYRGGPSRVLDLLETDGGWLTADGLVACMGGSVDAVEKSLRKLVRLGHVEVRNVETNEGPFRMEYRYAE